MAINHKWGIKSLPFILLMATSLVLVGCDDDDDDDDDSDSLSVSTDDTNYTIVNNPTGSISGLVQDTNGMPIQGATVYVGNQSTSTNAGGRYYFSTVKVTQTVPREDNTYAQAISLTIVPPAGYLGATVTAEPQTQLFECTTSSNAETCTEMKTVFINGFAAEAGVAVLPSLDASVNGVLRHQNTGEALASQTLSLDVVSVNGNNQEQDINGVTFSYATANYTATTDANGAFSFTELPADTLLNITSMDLEIIGGATTVNTDDEYGMEGLAVEGVPFEFVDSINPFVTQVAEVGDQTAARGVLSDDFTTVLTVEFSENMDDTLLDTNSIVVRDVDSAAYISTTNALIGNTLTITLGSSVAAGNDLDVWLLKDDFKDISANELATGTDVGYDANGTTATNSRYLQLLLTTFEEANANATSPTQAQLSQDATGVDTLEAIQTNANAANTAYIVFRDVDDDDAGIQQLNSADNDDSANGIDASERLGALLTQVAGTIGATGSTTVESDNALISFAPTNASYYYLNVTDEAGNDVVSVITEEIKQGATFGTSPDVDTRRIDADGTNANIIVLVGDSVEPGYVVTVTPYDDFGYAGTPNSVTLADNVPPTTILQTSYGVGDEENGSVTSLQYGDGGEQASIANVTPGTPYFDLTPRLLGQADGTSDGPQDDVNYVETFEALYDENAVNPTGSSNTSTTIGDQFINESTNVYDATAWAAFLAGYDFSRTLGVAFSEDVYLVTTGETPTFTAAGSASAPTGYAENNDVVIDDDGTTVNADLINFDLANVYNFALQENGAVLSFIDAVKDFAENIATETAGSPTDTTNARVVFRDMIPPMVESAIYDGRTLTVVFDKDINTTLLTDDAVTMTLNGETIDLSDAANYTWTAATDTLVATLGDAYGTFDTGTTFNLAQYNDVTPTLAADVSGDADKYKHAGLDFSRIPNVNGATWDDYNNLGAANEGYFQEPTFAAVNVVEVFSEDVTGEPSAGLGTTAITVNYDFTHAIDLDNVNGADNLMDSSEIQAIFQWSGGTINATGNTLTITEQSDGATRYTFVLQLSGVSAATQTLDADFDGDAVFAGDGNDRVSLYDGSGYAATQITF